MFFAQFAHEVYTQIIAIQVFKTTLARQQYAKCLVHEQIYCIVNV